MQASPPNFPVYPTGFLTRKSAETVRQQKSDLNDLPYPGMLSRNVIETFKNPLRPGLEKYLKRCSCIHVSYAGIFCYYLYSCSIKTGNRYSLAYALFRALFAS